MNFQVDPTRPKSPDHRRQFRSLLPPMLGTLLSVALLWWLFRRVDVPEVWHAISALSPWAVLASSVVICLSIPLRAQQWRWLLDGPPEVTAGLSIWAICLGNLMNVTIPARGGEVVKAWLLSRRSGLPVSRVITSLVIARVLDLGCILLLLGLMFAFIPTANGISGTAVTVSDLPLSVSQESLNSVMKTLVVATVMSAALLVLLSLNSARFGGCVSSGVARVSPSAARAWDNLWGPVGQALGVIHTVGHFWGAVGLNLLCWLVFVMTPVPMLLTLGLDFSDALVATLGIAGLTTLAQLVPAAPLALGTFHATCLLGLALFCPEVDKESALAFTLVFHLVDMMAASIPGLFLVPGAWGDLRAARRNTHQRSGPEEATNTDHG